MKRAIPLLICISLLAGCNGASESSTTSAPEITSAAQTTEITEQTSAPTAESTAPAESKEDDSTESTEESETEISDGNSCGTAVYDDSPLRMTYHSIVNIDKLREQLGYDIPVDVSSHPVYQQLKKQTEDYTEEYREMLLQQKFLNIGIGFVYIGSKQADWLLTADYRFIDYPSELIYRRIMLVKDDVITEFFSEELSEYSYMNDTEDGKLIARNDGTLYSFDINTRQFTELCSIDEYETIPYISDRFILFGNGALHCYDRETGEVSDTGIMWSYMEGDRISFADDKIFYERRDPDTLKITELRIHDLVTGEDILRPHLSANRYMTEGREHYVEILDTEGGYNINALNITRKSDGKEMLYLLDDFPDNVKDSFFKTDMFGYNLYDFEIQGQLLLLRGEEEFALDMETGIIRPIENAKAWWSILGTERLFTPALQIDGDSCCAIIEIQ